MAKDVESFAVCKYILASRCPIFAALVNKDEIVPNQFMEHDSIEDIKQFMKFIYTGYLDNTISDLTQFALKYGVATLDSLGQAASPEFSAYNMTALALQHSSYNQDPLEKIRRKPVIHYFN